MLKKKLLFYRDYTAFSGGHLKVWHYYQHAAHSQVYEPAVFFTPRSVTDASNPWINGGARIESEWCPQEADAVFIGGLDWWALGADFGVIEGVPIVNIIQGLRHAQPHDPRYAFLGRKAVRLCVNPAIESALRAVPTVRGPLFTIPMGLDAPVGESKAAALSPLVVAACKAPALGMAIVERLTADGIPAQALTKPLPRETYLDVIGGAHTVICLPSPVEGFYLPALEAMAMGKLVVCPDCGGNRTYLRDRINGFLPAYGLDAILAAAHCAVALADAERCAIVANARTTASAYDLAAERRSFLRVLDDLNAIWRG